MRNRNPGDYLKVAAPPGSAFAGGDPVLTRLVEIAGVDEREASIAL